MQYLTKQNSSRFLFFLSVVLNVLIGIYFIIQWAEPPLPYRTVEQRLRNYLAYVPESAKTAYQQRISENLNTILTLTKEIRQERQKIAGLFTEDTINKEAIMASFRRIQEKNQQINIIYEINLIDTEAELPKGERQKTHDLIEHWLKQEGSR